jgi:hypothetical protein
VNTGQRLVLGAWIAFVGLVTIRRLASPGAKGFPEPSLYLGSGILFTLFYVLGAAAPPLAGALAIGVDVSMLLRPYLPGQDASGSPATLLARWLDNLTPPAAQPSAPPSGTANPADRRSDVA